MSDERENIDRWRLIFRGLFDANPAHVVLLDLDGVILETNTSWRKFAAENGVPDSYQFMGKNYLDSCQSSTEDYGAISRRAYVGLQQVLQLQRAKFTMTYPCHSPQKQQWFRMWAEPQLPQVPVVVVAHYLLNGPTPAKSGTAIEYLPVTPQTPQTMH